MVIGKISIFPVLVVIILSTIGYQEVYGDLISAASTIGTSGISGNDNSHFNALIGVTVDSAGNIYVADRNSHRIQIFDSAGVYKFTIGVSGTPGADNLHLNFPAGVAVDSAGNIYVSDTGNYRIQIFDSTGAYLFTIGTPGVRGSDNSHFDFPAGITLDSAGNIYVVDSFNHRIQIFDSSRVYLKTINISSIPDEQQAGIAVDSAGNIYVSDTDNHRVQIFDSSGAVKSTIGITGVAGSANNQFNFPSGVAVDSAGHIYVGDGSNHRVQIFDLSGTYELTIGETGIAGTDNSHFNFPYGVAVDSAGKIYVADSFNFRVQIFSAPVIPNPSSGSTGHYSGDNPPSSRLKPSFGGTGNMVFADGLTLDGKVYDIGNFKQTIPKNIADVGQPITIKIKEQLAYGPQDWKYVAVYMNFGGKDPETYNARLILSNDKNDGQKIVDPNGYIKDYTVTTETNAPYVFTTFSFTVAKAMADTSMIVTGWDSHNRVNNVYVGGAIQFGKDPIIYPQTIPPSLHIYTNVRDADFAVENSGYVKPELFAHISNTVQMWNEPNTGHVRWFFDSALGQVAILSYDKNGDMVWHKEQILKRDQVVLRASYSGQHLDRTKEMEMKSAKSAEELRSVQTLERLNFHN